MIRNCAQNRWKPFTHVKFELTPTYVSLPKDYAPFSPFTDGGMLFHSGRFFACPELCDGSINKWHISIKATKHDRIIVDGIVHHEDAHWIDSDSGQKVYVGKGQAIQDENFVSLIDEELPIQLKKLMAQNLPKMLSYFSEKLENLNYLPSLYASFSLTDDGSYGHQGGTLPGQIFMHWYGEKSIEELDENSTFWFFAHELAHLYQGEASKVETLYDAWLHEGSAELFAGILYVELNTDTKIFLKKIDSAQETCLKLLEREKSYRKVALTNPNVHYSCGLLIFNAINNELQAMDNNIFMLWKKFNIAVEKGKPVTSITFVEVIKPFVSDDFWISLSNFVNDPEFDASKFFQQLASNKSLSLTANASTN